MKEIRKNNAVNQTTKEEKMEKRLNLMSNLPKGEIDISALREESERRIIRAKVQLILDKPFFGTLASYLDLQERLDIPSMGITESGILYFNPLWIAAITDDEIKGVLAHEILHLVFQHFARVKHRDRRLWNMAGDYAINLVVDDEGLKLPENGLLDRQYEDLSTEDIYEKLQKEKEEKGGKEEGGKGEGEEGEGFDKHIWDGKASSRKDIAREWEARVKASYGKGQGSLSGRLRELLDKYYSREVPWYEVLRDIVAQEISRNSADYSWLPPNRRYASRGIYYPSCIGRRPSVYYAIDTSGSMSTEDISKGISELDSLKLIANIKGVLMCDTEVHKVDISDIKEAIGRGGTSFVPVFEYLERDTPEVLIYFTDTWGQFPERKPNYKVIWVVPHTQQAEVPFGTVIRLKGGK